MDKFGEEMGWKIEVKIKMLWLKKVQNKWKNVKGILIMLENWIWLFVQQKKAIY
jgi:hypothetical protein